MIIIISAVGTDYETLTDLIEGVLEDNFFESVLTDSVRLQEYVQKYDFSLECTFSPDLTSLWLDASENSLIVLTTPGNVYNPMFDKIKEECDVITVDGYGGVED